MKAFLHLIIMHPNSFGLTHFIQVLEILVSNIAVVINLLRYAEKKNVKEFVSVSVTRILKVVEFQTVRWKRMNAKVLIVHESKKKLLRSSAKIIPVKTETVVLKRCGDFCLRKVAEQGIHNLVYRRKEKGREVGWLGSSKLLSFCYCYSWDNKEVTKAKTMIHEPQENVLEGSWRLLRNA